MSQSKQQPSFKELLESAQGPAVHLEMRDAYGIGPEASDFEGWKRTGRRDVDAASDYWAPWVDLIRRTVARGAVVRRAHIVSEPVTEYIRYEHAGTPVNIAAGEQIRWLPRRQASDIALPGNDFWLFDGRVVMFNHFAGDGASAGPSATEPLATAKLCASAFEAVWERGIPHERYTV
ncbi:DUF6879 family protein [Streptomyces olivoreticuli]|uniref:DUF6879 family protein n=1 Tax=Streptomyces olivoreticuli TaxID=68246 RepID=UPI000E239CC2|nr:DUF6879 family protein [Streptomyces olivoreticuli]